MKSLPTDAREVHTVQLEEISKSTEDTCVKADSASDVAVAEPPCPRCGGKLLNPESLGWCSACGYCGSLEAEGAKAVLESATVRRSSRLGAVEFCQLLQKLPKWAWVLMGGTATVVLVSILAALLLAKNSFPRAVWSSIQLGVGWLTLLLAQWWVLLQLAPQDDSLGPRDFFVPIRLWRLAVRRMPETCKPVSVGAWSASAMLCAVLVVGGLDYWYQYYKPMKVASKNLLSAAQDLAKGDSNKSLTEAVQDFANSQDLTKKDKEKADKQQPKEDKRQTVQCVIIGYVLATEATPFTLLVATLRDEKLSYAGLVRDGLTPESTKELLKRLSRLEREESVFRSLRVFDAVWVQPQIFCEVHQDGFDNNGKLLKPNFKALLQ